jgi:hypothetical protein
MLVQRRLPSNNKSPTKLQLKRKKEDKTKQITYAKEKKLREITKQLDAQAAKAKQAKDTVDQLTQKMASDSQQLKPSSEFKPSTKPKPSTEPTPSTAKTTSPPKTSKPKRQLTPKTSKPKPST